MRSLNVLLLELTLVAVSVPVQGDLAKSTKDQLNDIFCIACKQQGQSPPEMKFGPELLELGQKFEIGTLGMFLLESYNAEMAKPRIAEVGPEGFGLFQKSDHDQYANSTATTSPAASTEKATGVASSSDETPPDERSPSRIEPHDSPQDQHAISGKNAQKEDDAASRQRREQALKKLQAIGQGKLSPEKMAKLKEANESTHVIEIWDEDEEKDQEVNEQGLTKREELQVKAQRKGNWLPAEKHLNHDIMVKKCERCAFFHSCLIHDITHRIQCRASTMTNIIILSAFLILVVTIGIYAWKPVVSMHEVNLDGVTGHLGECTSDSQFIKDKKVALKTLMEERGHIAFCVNALDTRIEGTVAEPKKNDRHRAVPSAEGQKLLNSAVQEELPESDESEDETLPVESEAQAKATVIAATMMPYLIFAKNVDQRARQLEANVVQKTKEVVVTEMNQALHDSVGLPSMRTSDWQTDLHSLLLGACSVVAPFQLTMLWLSSVLGLWIRVIYIVAGIIILTCEWEFLCGPELTQVIGMKTWIMYDIAMQLLHVILISPVVKLARQACREIQRPETAFVNPNDPIACLRDIILEDSTYGSFAIFRYDQINALPALELIRWLKYVDFCWLLMGLSLVFDRPFAFCSAIATLYIARLRVVIFVLTAGVAVAEVLLNGVGLLLNNSDSAFYNFMKWCEDFDKSFAPMGLPVTATLARSLIVRDCSNMSKVTRRMLKRERGLAREEIKQHEDMCKQWRKEIRRIDKHLKKSEGRLKSYLEKEKKLEVKFAEDLAVQMHDFEEKAIVLAHKAESQLEKTEMGHKALAATRDLEKETMAYYQEFDLNAAQQAAQDALQAGQDAAQGALQAGQDAFQGQEGGAIGALQQAQTATGFAIGQAQQATGSALDMMRKPNAPEAETQDAVPEGEEAYVKDETKPTEEK